MPSFFIYGQNFCLNFKEGEKKTERKKEKEGKNERETKKKATADTNFQELL